MDFPLFVHPGEESFQPWQFSSKDTSIPNFMKLSFIGEGLWSFINTKPILCKQIAKFYIKIAHLFAAILKAVNPVYKYDGHEMSIMNKSKIPKGAQVKLAEINLCNRRIKTLKAESTEQGKIKVRVNNCHLNRKVTTKQLHENILDDLDIDYGSEVIRDKTLGQEIGIPELEKLYYDIYDYGTGKFNTMSDKSRNQYNKDLKSFYKTFTGKDDYSKWNASGKQKFSNIPLIAYHDSAQCKDNNSAWQQSYQGSDANPLFSKFANNVKTMLRNTKKNQQKFGFIHQVMASLALHGNAFIFVDRDRQGRVVAVENIHPNNIKVHMRGMEKVYEMSDKTILTNDNILHIVWFSYPQEALGLSPLRLQKNTMGLALAMERHINQFYSQGATPSSVLETDRDLTAEQAQSLQQTWTSHHTRSRKPAVLTGGLRWKAVSREAGESLIQARDQVTQEIARIFRIPSYLINSKGDSQTYSNIESAGINFVRHTLLAWISRLEDNLSTLVAGQSFINFDTAYYLRGDQLSRIRAGQAGISSGIFTPNEVREWFDYEPYESGDEFYLGIQ